MLLCSLSLYVLASSLPKHEGVCIRAAMGDKALLLCVVLPELWSTYEVLHVPTYISQTECTCTP